jgi:hypothetical protein
MESIATDRQRSEESQGNQVSGEATHGLWVMGYGGTYLNRQLRIGRETARWNGAN